MEGNTRQLQQLWLRQLQLEFDEICASRNLALAPPVLEITDSRQTYGCWRPATRTLALSRHLIENHPWDVTLQVLKHEMAHQLCSSLEEQGRGLPGRAHGELFRQACELLGVLPEFRRAGVVLPAQVAEIAACSTLSQPGRQRLGRIEKLLALGRSANAHEAALAMEKANELMAKYHLQGLGQGEKPHHSCVVIDRKRKRLAGYQRHLCGILQEFFLVRVVLSQRFDPAAGESYKTIELFGTPENTAIAEYCYDFLENRLALLWAQNGRSFNGRTRTEKTSYYLGLLRGFSLKLRAQKQARTAAETAPAAGALMAAEEQRLAHFVGLYHPRLRRASSRGARVYGGTYRAGVETGKTIVLAEGVGNKDSAFGGLLPG